MSEESGYPGAPPGWYPDPAGGPGKRWWDGYAWTDATVLPQPPPWASAPPPQGPPSQVAPWAVASDRLHAHTTHDLVQAELRSAIVARVAVAVPAACSIATLIINRLNADAWLAVGHQLRVDYHDAQLGRTPPPYHGPSALTPANVLINVAFVAAAIIALVWQHRAASAGRALGIPSQASPAWGVGSWFVPVVCWWIPYTAVRDCLPAGDAHRARVLHWWVAWLVTQLLGFAVAVCALFSSGAALALSIPVALADLAIIAWAPGIVMAIAAAHRAASAHLDETAGLVSN